VPQLAGQADPATVRFDDRFADGQAHASAMHLHALIPSAVKFFKHE
jgi:hypothetical protein